MSKPESKTTTTESGWVIEHHKSPPFKPLYWCGKLEWTDRHLSAVRFSRKEDAESVQEFLGLIEDEAYNHRVAYHEWG